MGASFTGGSGNDAFVADNSSGTERTSAADNLDGGAGTDTLTIYSDGTIAALPTLTSVETVTIYDEDTNLSLAVTQFSSVTTANFERNDGDVGITVGANVATVNLADMALNDAGANNGVTITFDAADTAAVVGLNKITVGTNTADEDVNLVGAALATVTVNAAGTASSFEDLIVAGASNITVNADVNLTVTALSTTSTTGALTITGAGAVNLGALDDGINTITATTATGALTAAIGAAVDTVMTLGSGNDVITASTTDALVTADTLAVNAGAGTGDIIIKGDAADIDTAADAARYTNFEIVQTAHSFNMGLMSSLTGLNVAATGGAVSFTNLTATQAANVKFVGNANAAGTSFALANSVGTSDVLGITIGDSSTAAGTSFDADSLTFNGFETLNLTEAHGSSATAGAQRTATVADFTSDVVTTINLAGSAFSLENIATTLAVTINGTNLTGDGAATVLGMTVAGSALTGSTVNGSAYKDQFTIGATGSTYNGAAGNDLFITTQTIAAGSTLSGGDGTTDTLRITDAAVTTAALAIDDNTFKTVSGFEVVDFSGATAGSFTWTLGGYANAIAAGNGGVIKATATALVADSDAGDDIVVNAAGLGGTNAIHLTLTDTAAGANDNGITITGSAGNDTFIITEAGAASTGAVSISAGAGNDTITVTLAGTDGTSAIDGGAGNDTITGSGDLDTITGGAGTDTMTGGAGANIYVFTTAAHSNAATAGAIDIITDFVGGSNQIKVGATGDELNSQTLTTVAYAGMDTIDELNTLLNASSGTSTAKFDGTGNDVALLTTSDARVIAAIDVDGNGSFTVADVVVELTGLTGTFAFGDVIV